MFAAALLGCGFGFISAIPIAGPISAIIFSQGMEGKFKHARGIALGAALVEGAYAFVAFWGFNHFLSKLSYMFLVSNAFAALILAALGVYFFKSEKMRKPASPTAHKQPSTERSFLIGAGISLANPSLIATWTASITTIYSMDLFAFTEGDSALFSGGVALGIFAWFSILVKLIARYRDRLNYGAIDKVLKGIGIFLMLLSLWMFYRLATQPMNR